MKKTKTVSIKLDKKALNELVRTHCKMPKDSTVKFQIISKNVRGDYIVEGVTVTKVEEEDV